MSSHESAVPWRSRTVQVVLASTLLAPLGVPLVSPALPAVRDAFGLTDPEASLLVSVYFATGIVLSPLVGLLADRLGRRRVLVPSLVVFSLAGAAVALRPPFALVLLARTVQGTAAAGVFVTTVALVGDTFEGARRSAVLGVNTAALSVGAGVYPLVGGALVTLSWSAPFAAYLVGLPVAAFAALALEEPPGERERHGLAYLRRVARALPSRSVAVLYGSAFAVEVALFGAVFTALPFFLSSNFGLGPVAVGAVVTAAEAVSAVAAAASGRLAERLSGEAIVAVGFGSAGVGLLGAWAATGPVFVAVAGGFLGAGWGLTFPAVDAGVSEAVPAQFRAGALSLRNGATFLGRTTGPFLFTASAAVSGYRLPLLGAAVAAFAWGGVVAALAR